MRPSSPACRFVDVTPNELVGLQSGINAILKVATDARAENAERFDAIDRELLEQRAAAYALEKRVTRLERPRSRLDSSGDIEEITLNGTVRHRPATEAEIVAAGKVRNWDRLASILEGVTKTVLAAAVVAVLAAVAVATLRGTYSAPRTVDPPALAR